MSDKDRLIEIQAEQIKALIEEKQACQRSVEYTRLEIDRLTQRLAESEAERKRLARELAAKESTLKLYASQILEHASLLEAMGVSHASGEWRAPFYQPDGTAEMLPVAEWIERRKTRARELAEAKQSIDGLNEQYDAALDTVVRMQGELAEARKDTARLDWLEKQMDEWRYHADFAIQSDEEDGVWFARITRHDCGELRGIPLEDGKAETVRAALDAARTGGQDA